MKITRQFYIKPTYTKYTPTIPGYPENMFECYLDINNPAAVFFAGKSQKPAWHYKFNSVEEMKGRINQSIKSLMDYEDRKIVRKEKMTQPTTLKEGDILYSSWGWEQTNIDFYQVTKILGKRNVEITQISQSNDTTDMPYDQGKTMPIPHRFVGQPIKKVVKNGNSVTLTNYASAYPWDGRPLHYSTYA